MINLNKLIFKYICEAFYLNYGPRDCKVPLQSKSFGPLKKC